MKGFHTCVICCWFDSWEIIVCCIMQDKFFHFSWSFQLSYFQLLFLVVALSTQQQKIHCAENINKSCWRRISSIWRKEALPSHLLSFWIAPHSHEHTHTCSQAWSHFYHPRKTLKIQRLWGARGMGASVGFSRGFLPRVWKDPRQETCPDGDKRRPVAAAIQYSEFWEK
jgi:hypothetical protein